MSSESSHFLKRHYVSEKRSAACHIKPNASCPVCGEMVYLYQNASGLRMYLDDLGWDWPKHSCTNSPEYRHGGSPTVAFPDQRVDLTTTLSLMTAVANERIVFVARQNSNGWLRGILIVAHVIHGKTEALVRFLDETRTPRWFRYDGTSPFLGKHAMISYKGNEVVLPDQQNLEPSVITVTWLKSGRQPESELS